MASDSRFKVTALDRFIGQISPSWGINRIRARARLDAAAMVVRHYEAAEGSYRTQGYARSFGDANVSARRGLHELRLHARDLVRNNGWAKNAKRIITNHTVGAGGLRPKAYGGSAEQAMALWRQWADTTECHSEGRLTFAGIQAMCAAAVVESGEVLLRARFRRTEDGLSIPLQLQILEADYLDTSRENWDTSNGAAPIVQGVEYDKLGRRAAYWIFESHPGSLRGSGISKRIPASEIAHIFLADRPGQVRGIPWFAPAIIKLRDFNEYDDATLYKQKIAACLTAFVGDPDGSGTTLGGPDAVNGNPLVETFEPGMVLALPPGRDVTFSTPPPVNEHASYTSTNLRWIAAALGVAYEDLTGDYSQSNFSSSRSAQLAHWQNVEAWRRDMMVPTLCVPVWGWAMTAAQLAGGVSGLPTAEWTGTPMPLIDPDKEARATMLQVRAGMKTPSEVAREQGWDPDAFFSEYADDQDKLEALGIKLDSLPRDVTQSGQAQMDPAAAGAAAPQPATPPKKAKTS